MSEKKKQNEKTKRKKYRMCPCGFKRRIIGGLLNIGDKAKMPEHKANDGANDLQTKLCRNVGCFYFVCDEDGNIS